MSKFSRRFATPFFSSSGAAASGPDSTVAAPSCLSTTEALALSTRIKSHVVVDLACPRVKEALGTLLSLEPLVRKIRSATINAHTLFDDPCRFGRVQFEMAHVMYIFEKLAALPKLQSLTIELNFHVISLPVKALLILLAKKKLKKLKLSHLHLIGTSMDEFYQLQQMASTQHQLQYLAMDCVHGVAGIQALVRNLPALVDLRMHSTALVPPEGLSAEEALLSLLTPSLRCLALEDPPQFDDSHCVALAEALALPGCQLRELYLVSSMLSDVSAKAVTDMLLTNTSLEKVTLHIDSDHMGKGIAQVVKANLPNLKSLYVRLYNDVPHDCLAIAKALQLNQHLTHLRLRSEVDLELLPKEILGAFEKALRVPSVVLQSLSMDDGMHRYLLPCRLKLQLQLNQCGVRSLLQQSQAATPHQLVETLIETITSGHQQKNENVDATFTLLSQVPELFLLALEQGKLEDDAITAPLSKLSQSSKDSMHPENDKKRTRPKRYTSPTGMEWKKMLLTVRSPQKVVHRMFQVAPSA